MNGSNRWGKRSPSGDAAFARPEVYEALEERGMKYAIRIPANDSLERDIAELLRAWASS
ncbi:MAG TPA: transposase [Terriglobales bacterium]|nr:transposase [Terriglobales bacterium]